MQMDMFECDEAERVGNAQEQWRAVPGFERYEVSSLGRFRNRRSGRLLTGTIAANGYVHVGLMKNAMQEWFLGHRIVAAAFLGEPPTSKHTDVNHKNRDRADNRACNLEWVTRSQNAKHWAAMRRESSAGA